jgi:hypothetical protein
MLPPTKSFNISKLLLSYAKSDPPATVRKPITEQILLQMVGALEIMPFTPFDRILLASVFNLMYHVLLRVSEVTPSKRNTHQLLSRQIVTKSEKPGLMVSFLTFKFSKPGATNIKVLPSNNKTCAVRAYAEYRIWKPKSQMAFVRIDGSPITASFVNKSLRDVLSFLGFDSSEFSSHSFRIGKATDMAKRGFTDIQICMAGRWSSAAFKKYIKPQLLQFQ